MKKFFAEMQYSNQPKNKAEKAVQQFARELNGTLVYGDDNIEVFVRNFRSKVDEINTQFPRCRDIDTSYTRYINTPGHWVSAIDVARISFHEVKHEFPGNPASSIQHPATSIQQPVTSIHP